MTHPFSVEQFIAEELSAGRWTIQDRETLWEMGESGAGNQLLYGHLTEKGYKGGYYSINSWRSARFGKGSLAVEMNAMARQARGLSASDTLNMVAIWMVNQASRFYEELKSRDDLSNISTKDLAFLLSLSSSKILSVVSEADKIKSLANNRDLIIGMIEETRATAKQIYEIETPEAVPIVEHTLAVLQAKLDI